MKIAEIYQSRQGEGVLTGTQSVFVRVSGCNLRCWYCDTPYTSWAPEGEDLPVDEILTRVLQHDCDHVVLTGGEPMLFAELVPLAQQLHDLGKHITIETAGTLHLTLPCDLMSISPKLSNSTPAAQRHAYWSARHERSRHVPEVIRQLITEYEYQIKFVVDSPADGDQAAAYLREFPQIDARRVMLMPQGKERDELQRQALWLQPYCAQHGFVYCPRKQIEWYGPRRGV